MEFWRSHGQAIAESLRERAAKLNVWLAIEGKRLSNLDCSIIFDVIAIAKKTSGKH